MKYDVNVYENSQVIVSISEKNPRGAAKTAEDLAKEYPSARVFVEWFRPNDGQHGYLNPDGNHDITGEAW